MSVWKGKAAASAIQPRSLLGWRWQRLVLELARFPT